MRVAYDWAVEPLQRHGKIEAWVIDDTPLPKQGNKSVGVARQYCTRTGQQENCQVAVTWSVVNGAGSPPVGYRLYLPEDWAQDRERRREVGVWEEVVFRRNWDCARTARCSGKLEGCAGTGGG